MAEGLSGAGQFKIDHASILTSSGLEVNILPSIVAITLYEDTEMMTVSGNILMQDSGNLASIGPLIGQEYLRLKIRTPTFKNETAIIDYTENAFVINTLQGRSDIGNNVQGYLLSFITQELVANQRTRVNEVLRGSYSSMVQNMLINHIGTKKDIYTEPTAKNKKIITPNISPFSVIKKAMKESVSKRDNNTSYMFFENIRGFHFRSLASMYAQKPQLSYTTSIAGSKVGKGGSIDVLADLQTVLGYEIVGNSDSLVNYTLGTFGSKLIIHDIFNKNYSTHLYNYLDSFDKESHIVGMNPLTKGKTEYPIYSATPVDDAKRRVSDFPSRQFMFPTSIKDVDASSDSTFNTSDNSYPFTANVPNTWIQKTTSQKSQLKSGFLLDVAVHGNTLLNAGDVVEMSLPYKAGIKTSKKETEDRFYKGAFFVKKITHNFDMSDGKHSMFLLLTKDSLEEPLADIYDNLAPQPKKSPIIYNEIDDFYGI